MEYGLIIFAITAVLATIVFAFGGTIHDLFETSCTRISAQAQTGDCNPP